MYLYWVSNSTGEGPRWSSSKLHKSHCRYAVSFANHGYFTNEQPDGMEKAKCCWSTERNPNLNQTTITDFGV